MDDLLLTIFLSSLLFVAIYPFVLLLMPDNLEDELFSFFDGNIKEENLINQIRVLGKINNHNYESQIKQIRAYFADHKISDKEFNEIDRFMTKAYFDEFHDRWIAFRKADMVLKLVCIYSVLASALMYLMIIFNVETLGELSNLSESPNVFFDFSSIIGYLILGFFLLYVFMLLCLGAYSMFFGSISMLFSKKGNIVRRMYILDEMIRALKPGGRYTPIFPNTKGDNESDKVMYIRAMLLNKKNKS